MASPVLVATSVALVPASTSPAPVSRIDTNTLLVLFEKRNRRERLLPGTGARKEVSVAVGLPPRPLPLVTRASDASYTARPLV